MDKDLDFIITRHDFKTRDDIFEALIEAYKAGIKYAKIGQEQAVWEAGSKMQ